MGNNIRCHLLSTSYSLGVRGCFCCCCFGVLVFFFNIPLYLFSQNWIVTFYTEVIGMSQTRGDGGIQDKGNGVGKRPRGVETHKEGVS